MQTYGDNYFYQNIEEIQPNSPQELYDNALLCCCANSQSTTIFGSREFHYIC